MHAQQWLQGFCCFLTPMCFQSGRLGTVFATVPQNQRKLLRLPAEGSSAMPGQPGHRVRRDRRVDRTVCCSPSRPAAPPAPAPATRAAALPRAAPPCPPQHHGARPWVSAAASSPALLSSSPFSPFSLSRPWLTLQTAVTHGAQSQRHRRPCRGDRAPSSRSPPAAS